jgi:ATP-dependent Clp protease ATP-binding subunit ClpA
MFDRFSSSARSVVFRAGESAVSEGRKFIEPRHILSALIDLHPELFERLSTPPVDIHSVQRDLAEITTPSLVSRGQAKLRFDEQSKRVMQVATREARFCWEQWEAPRRTHGQLLPEDQSYWQGRLRGPTNPAKFDTWLGRWLLRRKWEVDERHLLLGLLHSVEYPAVAVLTKRGVTLESARQRLCATAG